MSTQCSPREVAVASSESSRLVRPEEGGPAISEIRPRGKSMPWTPVGRVSGSTGWRQPRGKGRAIVFAISSPIVRLHLGRCQWNAYVADLKRDPQRDLQMAGVI